jgi:polar amino acid transport system permease protein
MVQIVPQLLRAAGLTIEISVLAILFSALVGMPLAMGRIIGPRWLRALVFCFVEFIRGVPPLLVIAIVFFLLPRFGILLSARVSGVVALATILGAYFVEVARASVESLSPGQRESGLALGLREVPIFILILLPQAARRMLGPLTNEFANTIKLSSLLSVISVNELTKVGNDLIYINFLVFEVLIEVAVIYVTIVGAVILLANYLERKGLGLTS